MRTLKALLLLASLAAAIPLRKGASLVYEVERGWENDTTIATLMVKDSLVTDSGTLWMVAVRDSLLGGSRIRIDSATLLDRGNDTVWTHPSCLMAWDASQRKTASVGGSWYVGSPPAVQDIVLPFGAEGPYCAEILSTSNNSLSYYQNFLSTTYSLAGYRREISSLMVNSADRIPLLSAMNGVGWTRVDEPFLAERWLIRTRDGVLITDTSLAFRGSELLDSLRLGERWAWRTTTAGTTTDIGWTVSAVLVDSAGWTRRTIQEGNQSLDLRIDPFGCRTVVQPTTPVRTWLAAGFLHLANDSLVSEGVWSRDVLNRGQQLGSSDAGMPTLVSTWQKLSFQTSREKGTTLVDSTTSNLFQLHVESLPLSIFDGKAGDSTAWDSVVAPLSLGEHWNWVVKSAVHITSNVPTDRETDTTYQLRWMVTGAPEDSTGWIRRQFDEVDSGWQESVYSSTTGWTTTALSRTDDPPFELRYQPSTFTLLILPETPVRRILSRGFFLDGTESSVSPGNWLRDSLSMSLGLGPSAYSVRSRAVPTTQSRVLCPGLI
jgi:hypothetical protein